MKTIREIVYVPDYMAVLCVFNDNRQLSVNELHFDSGISYSSLHEMKKTFVEKGWVTIQHIEKKHIVMITTKGEELVKTIHELLDKLGIDKDEFLKLKLSRKHKSIKVKTNDQEESSSTENEEGDESKVRASKESTISEGLFGSEKGITSREE